MLASGSRGFLNSPSYHLRRTLRQVRAAMQERNTLGARNAAIAGLANIRDAILSRVRSARVRCSCCGYQGYAFVHTSNRLRIAWNSLCPQCASRSRHRGLALMIPHCISSTAAIQRVLHFAPEAALVGAIRGSKEALCYHTTDLNMDSVDFPGEDIQRLSFPAGSYDLVICNHVLEHVPDDERAVSEMSRILSPAGLALITIPGEWHRVTILTFADLSLNEHYRDYGRDVIQLFGRYFARVEVVDLHSYDRAHDGRSYAIRKGDMVFRCYKDTKLTPQADPWRLD